MQTHAKPIALAILLAVGTSAGAAPEMTTKDLVSAPDQAIPPVEPDKRPAPQEAAQPIVLESAPMPMLPPHLPPNPKAPMPMLPPHLPPNPKAQHRRGKKSAKKPATKFAPCWWMKYSR